MADRERQIGDLRRAGRRLLREGRVDLLQQEVLLRVRDDQVDPGDPRRLGGLVRRPAAGDHRAQPRADPRAAPRGLARVARRQVGDGAAVEDVEVGLFERVHHPVAGGEHLAGEPLDLRLVQLATEIREMNAHPGILPVLSLVFRGARTAMRGHPAIILLTSL